MSDLPLLSIAPHDGRTPLVFCWGVSSFYGWGINGLNLMLQTAAHTSFSPFTAIPFRANEVVLDPLREAVLTPLAAQSQEIWTALAATEAPVLEVDGPVLAAVANDFQGVGMAAHGKWLVGRPTIGVAFLEHAGLSAEGRQRADGLALVIAGSSWNRRILEAQGIVAVTTVLQGIDTSLFHPAPRAGSIPGGRFVVFSGGKLEFRKAQDLVLAAFRAFHRRHPEAVLMTAWHSPWSDLMSSAVGTPGIEPPQPAADGAPDIRRWAADNGIPAEAVIPLGPTPNIAMPHVIREADVALFPNRAEGGTNLVAMECMACGVPTILSANTGHLDLLDLGDVAIPLTRQTAVARDGVDTTDWGGSDVEEAVEALERVWQDRQAAQAMGARAAAALARMDWRRQTALLLRAIEPVVP